MKPLLLSLNAALIVAIALLLLRGDDAHRGRFEDVSIYFILSGHRSPPQYYTNRIWRGIQDAQQDLGCKVTVRETRWDRDRALMLFDSAITMGSSDAIITPGYPRRDEFKPFVDEARRLGIIVTGYGVPNLALEELYGADGFGRAGGGGYYLGERLAQRMAAKFRLGPHSRVLLVGSVSEKGRGDVGQAGLDVFAGAGITVDYIDLELARQGDPPRYAQQVVTEYLRERTDFDAIFFEASSVEFLVGALESQGIPPGRYQIAGIGLNADSLNDVKRGYVGLLASGDPYLQGYMPVLQACLTKRYGLGGMHVDSPIIFVDEENVDTYIDLVERGVR